MRQNVSPRSKFASLRERWIKLVASNKEVSRGDIILKLGLTPQQYYLNASPILETSQGLMNYVKEEKMWYYTGSPLIDKPIKKDEKISKEEQPMKDPEYEGIEND